MNATRVQYDCRPAETISYNGANYHIVNTYPNGVDLRKSSGGESLFSHAQTQYVPYSELAEAGACYVTQIKVVAQLRLAIC